jgi:hypothetical protein
MRSREREVTPYEGARFGVERGVVGIGEPLEVDPVEIEEAAEITAVTYGPKAARMLRRFASLPEQTLVWTRTDDDAYRLGRIAGSWRWDGSTAARAVGIHNVRDTQWMPRTFSGDEVPAAVVATFDRGGRNLQRTHDHEAERRSEELWLSA